MANDNLVVWTTDWHMLATDTEPSPDSPGAISPTRATAVVAHINALDPIGCFDTGDNKNNYLGHSLPVDPDTEWDNWLSIVGAGMPWLPVNAGDTNALYPTLPGNHDEAYDSAVSVIANDDFAEFDAKFWARPYHWTVDWDAPRIRFIGVHSYIHHQGTEVYPDAAGIAHVNTTELDWLENEINTLPDRWQAIICTHFPVAEAIGNNIKYVDDNYFAGTVFNDLMRDHSTKVICHLSGHRHENFHLVVQDSVTHIGAGGVSYGQGNGNGVFCPISYSPSARTITFDCRYAASPYARLATFTPITFQLQPHRLFFART